MYKLGSTPTWNDTVTITPLPRTGGVSYTRRCFWLAWLFGIIGCVLAILVFVYYGAFCLGFSTDYQQSPPPNNSFALLLIALGIVWVRPMKHSPAAVIFSLLAAFISALKPVLIALNVLVAPVAVTNLIMVCLLAGALCALGLRRLVEAQIIATVAATYSLVSILTYAFGLLGNERLIGVVITAAFTLSVSIILKTSCRGPMGWLLRSRTINRSIYLEALALAISVLVVISVALCLNLHVGWAPAVVPAVVTVVFVLVVFEAWRIAVRIPMLKASEAAQLPQKKNELVSDIERGLRDGEFFLQYQPQVDLPTNSPIGVEALVRWRHPEYGIVPPGRFIQIAEESLSIVPLGNFVLEEACMQAASWQGTPLENFTLSVNVSPIQLQMQGFVETVRSILEKSGFPRRQLVLELTESALLRRGAPGFNTLWALHELGIMIAIDDFGTGYSCLAYLCDLPVDYLKIDKSLVDHVPGHTGAETIARTIVGMGRGLGLSVIAEGVERPEQANFLKGIWCSKAQGYLYDKPLDHDALIAWASRWYDGDGDNLSNARANDERS